MQDKALQSEKMQDNPAKSRTVGNSVQVRCTFFPFKVTICVASFMASYIVSSPTYNCRSKNSIITQTKQETHKN